MELDEAISALQHAARFKPVALMACCAAELTRIKDPQELKVALKVVAVLAEIAAE